MLISINDARIICEFGRRMSPDIRPAPDEQTQRLAMMVSRRCQLVDNRTMEQNRYGSCTDELIRMGIKRHIDWLNSEIKDTDDDIDRQIKVMPLWQEKVKLLEEVGVSGARRWRFCCRYCLNWGSLTGAKSVPWSECVRMRMTAGK
ncbi:hypothetical protein [Enterobacter bugandensis]|uniref:hypothetical protein n=1 Tax=Enterobacter bugandensis TaxID=881260 RepID=UPI00069D2784